MAGHVSRFSQGLNGHFIFSLGQLDTAINRQARKHLLLARRPADQQPVNLSGLANSDQQVTWRLVMVAIRLEQVADNLEIFAVERNPGPDGMPVTGG